MRTFTFTLSWPELRSFWESVFLGPGHDNWKQVLGPLSAMKLSLRRIGWSMPSFTVMRDLFGIDLPLTLVSPALLKRHIRQAVLYLHERRAGAKFLPTLQQPVR
eukprot:5610130-Pyramimonas_sp.AAC.1